MSERSETGRHGSTEGSLPQESSQYLHLVDTYACTYLTCQGSASFALTHCNQLPEWDGTVELGSTVLSALSGIADRLPTLVAATQRAKAAAVVDPVLCDAFPDLPSKVLAQTLQDAEAQLANLRSIMYALPQAAGLPCAGSLSVKRAASGWTCRC